jgi:DNA-binding NtrC family response regulator
MKENRFRGDLYHRLSVFRLDLPPLRERLEDLDDLLPLIIAEFNASAGRHVKIVPEKIYRKMRGYDWPGNVRELRNVIERAVLLSEGELFPDRWLQLDSAPDRPCIDGTRLTIPLDGSMALDEMDSFIIQSALERYGYNVTATARALGTTRETLRYRIHKYHLNTEPPKINVVNGTGAHR